MKQLLIILLIVNLSSLSAQTTAIPDTFFEQALINQGYDLVLDGQILTANIDTLTTLNVNNLGISDLTGIQDFDSLQVLICDFNNLNTLDLTQNSVLTKLWCRSNMLSNLDVTQNALLIEILCFGNQLTSLDVSQNLELTLLDCGGNLLTKLDVFQNSKLNFLSCPQNQLTWLNVSANDSLTWLACSYNSLTCLNLSNGNNANLVGLVTAYNPNLTCIEVNDSAYSTTNWIAQSFVIDPQSFYSNSCPSPCTVGIDELSSSAVNIYPNPTQNHLTISLAKPADATVMIRNSLGQIIITDKFLEQNQLEMDLTNIPSGIYFLQVKIDGQISTKKIVKE